jgi:hypothetical protein
MVRSSKLRGVQSAWGNVKDAEKKAVDTKNESVDDSAGTEEIDRCSLLAESGLASLCRKAAGSIVDQGFASVYFRHVLKTLLRRHRFFAGEGVAPAASPPHQRTFAQTFHN